MTNRSLLLLALLPFAASAQQSTSTTSTTSSSSTATIAPTPTAGGVFAVAPRLGQPSDWTPTLSARYPQDPADSTYREARSLLNRGEWRRAARMFGDVAQRSPASAYAADALYWQAFALYRLGSVTDLREALAALDARKSRFPRAGNADEAESLITRVSGALAARGDAAASSRLRSAATAGAATCDSEELSVRASALSTLMRNDPESATPILTKVLDRRDDCSTSLRRSAVMMIGNKGDAAGRAKLADVAKNDPSPAVRGDAIGYLAQTNSDEAVTILEGILRADTVVSVQRSAVRTLGAMANPKAKAAIKALVERASAPERLRLDAIGTFDRRAGTSFSYSYACAGGGDCDAYTIARGEAELMSVNGRLTTTPMPPMPPQPAMAPVAPMAAPSPRPSPEARASTEVRAAIEARAEAQAMRADEVRAAQAARAGARTPLAVMGNENLLARWDDDDSRRISAEDAAWLRGVYARLETTRLKSAAAAVLARAQDDATRQWLIGAVTREEEPAEVRAMILNRLGRDLPIVQLGKLYDNASGRAVREQVVQVLGQRTEPEATDKLIEIVRSGTDPQLRRAAITALNGKKDPRTTQLLLELIDR